MIISLLSYLEIFLALNLLYNGIYYYSIPKKFLNINRKNLVKYYLIKYDYLVVN